MERVVRGVAGVLGLVLLLGACSQAEQDETTRDESGSVTEGGDVGVLRLQVGDCLEDQLSIVQTQVEELAAVPCDQPHRSEVFASFDLEGDEFPGEAEVAAQAEERCSAELTSFVGPQVNDVSLGVGYLTPSEVTWDQADDRTVLCLVSHSTKDLVGSVEGYFVLEVGDCFNDGLADGAGDVLEPRAIDCAQPHTAEVFHVATLPDGDFPGDAAVRDQAQELCLAQFAGYVGLPFEQSVLNASFLGPVEDTWAAGDREVVCYLTGATPGEQLSGSQRGANR